MVGCVTFPLPMDTGNQLVSTSKTSNIKSLLLEAWRQRWSPVDWAINIKRVLPRGVSGDVYDLSNCILIQALVGPTPNPLFISYLNHCISSQVVSYGSVLSSIAKYQEFNKSQCIICLLDLCIDLKKRINCYGNEEECISLCKSIVALAHWLYSCLSHALIKISELKLTASNQNPNQFANHGHHHHGSSHTALSGSQGPSISSVSGVNSQSNEYVSIVEKTCDILSSISTSSFIKSLFYVGKLEDSSIYSQLVSKVAEVEKLLTSGTTYIPSSVVNSKELIDIIVNFLKTTEWNNCDPTIVATQTLQARESLRGSIIHGSSPSDLVSQSLNAIIAINAILNPMNDIDVCARQISLVAKFNDLSLSDVCCEIIRSCFIELVDSSSSDLKLGEDLKWAAFTFLKVPQFFGKLSCTKGEKKSISADLEAGLEKLLTYTPLLDLTDAKSNCDCLELFLKELCQTELTVEQKNRIMARRHKDSHKTKDKPTDQVQGGQGASLILRAEPTVTSILKTLDSDYSKNQDGLLGVLNHMVPGKSFELILNAAAATGKLKSFTTKLIKFNEFNKQIIGESGKNSQTRALLFDITFLMLCHIAQNYGADIITANSETKDSFFATWCSQCLAEGGKYRSPDVLLSKCDPVKVDNLLSQFNSTDFELKTSLVKWHEVCLNAPSAIKEVLLAWEHGAITTENVKIILDNVKSKMCCLPVAISAWLCSYINILPHEERLKPMNMLQQFMTPASNTEGNNSSAPGGGSTNSGSGDSGGQNNQESTNTYYKERSMLMSNIIKKMTWDLDPPPQTKSKGVLSIISHGLTVDKPLWEMLENIFTSAHSRSWLDQRDVHNIDTVFCVGGPNWFVDALLRQLLKFEHASELNRAVGLIYGLFHLDIEQCALCLLVNILIGYLLKEDKQEALTEPKATALARLTVMTIFAALTEVEERKAGKPKISLKRHEYQRDVFMDYIPSEADHKMNNGNHSGEPRPAKMLRRSESQTSLNTILDDTPFFFQMNQQSVDTRILNEPLTKAIADLLRLFTIIISDSSISQRSIFPLIFLEQLILCGKQDSYKVLQFLPFQSIISLIKIMPGAISYEFLLAISNLQTIKARKIVARALCQLRRAKIDSPKFGS